MPINPNFEILSVQKPTINLSTIIKTNRCRFPKIIQSQKEKSGKSEHKRNDDNEQVHD